MSYVRTRAAKLLRNSGANALRRRMDRRGSIHGGASIALQSAWRPRPVRVARTTYGLTSTLLGGGALPKQGADFAAHRQPLRPFPPRSIAVEPAWGRRGLRHARR